MIHHFTVDVEEYFQVSALEAHVARDDWSRLASRLRPCMEVLLSELAEAGSRGTFFVLGWLAERQPWVVREIADAGHEVASHGWGHRRVTTITPQEFRASIRRSKRVLEDAAGAPVSGYRAPSFSIVRGLEWTLDALLEEGYVYDSSLFAIRRPGYGYAGGERDPHWLDRPGGRLAEVSPATLRVLGANLPAGGGAYFRLLPYGLLRAALRQAAARGQPGTFYLHPWELDPEQPRLPVPALTRVRHYGGLGRTRARLRRLLREFRFGPIRDTIERMSAEASARGARSHSAVPSVGTPMSAAVELGT